MQMPIATIPFKPIRGIVNKKTMPAPGHAQVVRLQYSHEAWRVPQAISKPQSVRLIVSWQTDIIG